MFKLGYFTTHIRALFSSLGQLVRSPFASFLTIAVIGIALALPLSFYIILQNANRLNKSWDNNSTQISVYLKRSTPKIRVQDLLRQLQQNPLITATTYIPAKKGLQEFATTVDAKKAIGALKTNPLPDVIVIRPLLSLHAPLAISKLVDSLQEIPEVATAKIDMEWLQRLNNIITLAKQGILAVALLLGFGVLLIIGNTIRLATQNERREIAILKMVGATNAFIRRPFLYIGAWYGLLGGLLAWLTVNSIIWSLQSPVTKLATSYNSSFFLANLDFPTGIHVLIISILLGLVGSWVSVTRELHRI